MAGAPLSLTVRRGRTVIAAIVGLAAVFLAIGLIVSSQPFVCAACHVSHAEALDKTAHADQYCYSCHLPDGAWSFPEAKAAEFFRMYPTQFFGRFEPSGTRISRAACVRCHDDLPEVTESKGLRIAHASCAPPPSKCDTCHGAAAHPLDESWVRASTMDDCTACHNRESAATDCEICHVDKLQTERLESGPWQVTHGPNWRRTHGMGDLDSCATCHGPEKCVKCHGVVMPHPVNYQRAHGADALDPAIDCSQCHASNEMCDACHGIEMPHPDAFLVEHSGVAETYEDERCSRCHADADCINCHVMHIHPGSSDGFLQDKLPVLQGGED